MPIPAHPSSDQDDAVCVFRKSSKDSDPVISQDMRIHRSGSLNGPNQLAFQNAQNSPEIVAAPQNLTIHADDGIKTLPVPQLGALFNAIERVFCCAAKHRKNCHVTQAGYTIVPPLAGGDHAPIERQYQSKLCPVKCNLRRGQIVQVRRRRRLKRHIKTVARPRVVYKCHITCEA